MPEIILVAAELSAMDYVLSNNARSGSLYKKAMQDSINVLLSCNGGAKTFSGASVSEIGRLLNDIDIFPSAGIGIEKALNSLGKLSVEHALDVGSASSMAHLHCPVAIPALAAESLISATNQSLDSWDQSPFATLLEEHVLKHLLRQMGAGETATGCFSSGGSQSNMTALYLALEQNPNIDRHRFVVFVSENAHFSIGKSARILGLSADAVIAVPADAEGCLSAVKLQHAIMKSRNDGRIPLAIIATAGTTDLGAIDPLSDIANIADKNGLWLHVDAAYGGGLLFTPHRHLLDGIERAHSVTLDFHKMLFQPISCAVLLVRDKNLFSPLALNTDYLNPKEAVFSDVPNLVERSMQTTRRGDALKVAMTMLAIGQAGISEMVCKTLDNAKAAAKAIQARDGLQLIQEPPLSTVLFRLARRNGSVCDGKLTGQIRERLFSEGTAAIATTVHQGHACFKLTLLNPFSHGGVVNGILDRIVALATELDKPAPLTEPLHRHANHV